MDSFLSLQLAMIKEIHRAVSLCCLTHTYTHRTVYIAHTQTYTHLFAWIINCERWQDASRWKEKLFWTFVEPSKHYNLPFSFAHWTMRASWMCILPNSLFLSSKDQRLHQYFEATSLQHSQTMRSCCVWFWALWLFGITSYRLQFLETQKGALHEIQ